MAPRQTNGRGMRYDSILDTVGDTPVIRINRIAPEGVNIFVKMEPSTRPDPSRTALR